MRRKIRSLIPVLAILVSPQKLDSMYVYPPKYTKENVVSQTSPKKERKKKVRVSPKELTCMADMAYLEARGEGVRGIEAVIHVALNRKLAKHFPNNICGVVYQRTRGRCQYSSMCSPRVNIARARYTKEYRKIREIAKLIMENEDRRRSDPTHGSLYFKRSDVRLSPFFRKLRHRASIGRHQFFVEVT